MPRPEGLPYVKDAVTFGEIYTRAQRNCREGSLISKAMGRKVQQLIDKHMIALGIDPKIPPLAISDPDFAAHVAKQVSDRAKASEMEHAVRHHIRKRLDQDPVFYRKLSERLDEILQKFGDNWAQLATALEAFVAEVVEGRQADDDLGLDPQVQAPFFDLLKVEREKEAGPVTGSDLSWLAGLTVQLVAHLTEAAGVVGFWANETRQEELRGQLFQFLDDSEIVDFERADAVADLLMELAKANRDKLVRP